MSQNRRSSAACARCYKRKKKCNHAYPSCSECARVGATCVGLDRDSMTEIPRSVVTFLETLVARLEANEEGIGSTEWNSEPSRHQASPQSNLSPRVVDYTSLYSLAVRTSSNAIPWAIAKSQSQNALPYLRTFFMGAELPFPLAFKTQRSSNMQFRDESLDINTIPLEVIDRLIAVYTERILPQYPFFPKQHILDIYDRYKRRDEDQLLLSAHEIFIIYMVLAITSLSSRSKDYGKLVALAESLRRNALDTLENGVNLGITSMINIQLLLLLAHYGFLLPSSANLWHITGDAMRMATELGLHQEVPPQSGLDPATIAFRRRFFWVLYTMERSVAVASHRPFSVRDEHIEVSFPVAYDDHDPSYLHSGQFSYIRFVDRLSFHLLRSELCAVNIGNRAIPTTGQNYGEWMIDMERRIFDTKARVIADAAATYRWCDFTTLQCILLLHMPCAHNPEPQESSLLKCFDAAVNLSEGYWETAQSDFVEYPWHAVHNAYEAGTLILYIISHFPTLIKLRHSTKRIFEVVHQLSGFFILMTKRWPATHLCGSLFDTLRKGALSAFLEEELVDPNTNLEMRRLKHVVFRENADLLYAYEEPLPVIRLAEDVTIPQLINPPDTPNNFSGEMDFLYLFDFSNAPDLGIGFAHEMVDTSMIDPAPEMVGSSASPATMGQNQQRLARGPQRDLSVDRLQLKTALGQLPVCSYCKRRRIKCDLNLPSCRNCAKSGKECMYMDHALSRETPRRYVHDLQQQVENLMRENGEQQQNLSSRQGTSTTIQASGSPGGYFGAATPEAALNTCLRSVLICLNAESEDSPRTLFLGPTSAFARLISHSPIVALELDGKQKFSSRPNKLMDTIFDSMAISVAGDPPQETADNLAQYYYQSLEICYPILGQDLIRQTIDNMYNLNPEDGISTATRTRFYLILAISFALVSHQDRRFYATSDIYFSRAISAGVLNYLATTPSIVSLQTTLLLCVYAWLRPNSNNIWRLLGHASRVCLDIVEMHGFEKTESAKIGVLYRTLYSLETHVAIASGRPRQLPDGNEAFVTSLDRPSPADKLSMLVYELARLQSHFHREMMTRHKTTTAANFASPMSPESTWIDTCTREMESWLGRWDAGIDSFRDRVPTWYDFDDLSDPLKFWGRFQQAEGLLLAEAAAGSKGQRNMSEEEKYRVLKGLLESGRRLYRGSYGDISKTQSSRPNFAFPVSWTHICSMFTAFVPLLHNMQSPMHINAEVDGLLEDYIAIVIAFEASIDHSLMGLSDCLQNLYRSRIMSKVMQ